MIIKVKEPVRAEIDLLRPEQLLFTYLHLAANEPLTRALIRNHVQAVAYETVQLDDGILPFLTPMSEVAGRMSVQVGAHHLEKAHGGSGTLLGGIPGVPGANVVVIGGGVVGTNAAQIALGMGANVTIIDKSLERLRQLDTMLHGRVNTLASNIGQCRSAVQQADLLMGRFCFRALRRRRSSLRRWSLPCGRDQWWSTSPSTRAAASRRRDRRPTATRRMSTHGVVHYCVTNMPGAVPRTSTIGLSNATLPYGSSLADHGLYGAIAQDPGLAKGVNVINGKIAHPGGRGSLRTWSTRRQWRRFNGSAALSGWNGDGRGRRGRQPWLEEAMQRDIERFLRVLETERGFSVNTIFAYRNDLTQFLAFLRGETVDEGGHEGYGSGPRMGCRGRRLVPRRSSSGISSPTSS